jgi:hypothetical protein
VKKHRKIPLLIVVLLFLFWAGVFIYKSSFVAIDGQRYFSLFDDAMISMRYAWNLAHGYGLVWNPGERVEGYTNLLMVLLMTPFNALIQEKRLVSLPIQAFGVITLLAIAYFGLKVFRKLAPQDSEEQLGMLEILFVVGILFYYPLAYFSLMGMETGLLTLLLLAAVFYGFNARDLCKRSDLMVMTILLGLAYLTRPDSLIYSAVIFGLILFSAITSHREKEWHYWIAICMVLFLLFPLIQLIFRWFYYGELVPNTYILKVHRFPWNVRIKNGIAFIKPFVIEFSVIGLLGLIGLVLDYSWKRFLSVLLFIMSVGYQIWVGGDAWRLWRFIIPTIPLIFSVAVHELGAFARAGIAIGKDSSWKGHLVRKPLWRVGWYESLRKAVGVSRAKWVFGILISILLLVAAFSVDIIGLSGAGFGEEQILLVFISIGLLITLYLTQPRKGSQPAIKLTNERIVFLGLFMLVILFTNKKYCSELIFSKPPLLVDFNLENTNRALAILDITREDATIGVTAAGVHPYFSGRYAIDFLGKMDKYIAMLPADISGGVAYGSILSWPGHNKYDLVYSILELRPTYIQKLNWGRQNLTDVASKLYEKVEYKGVILHLLKDSESVYWEKLLP